MTRQPLNDRFLRTSFLSGANAAYVEQMQAEYERNPGAVSDEWRIFFDSLNEERDGRQSGEQGPTWGVPLQQLEENGELVAALTSDFGATERQLRDNLQATSHMLGSEMSPAASLRAPPASLRPLLLIRAHRVTGHLAPRLDPTDPRHPNVPP